jgi:hypothetical protein
MADWTARVRQEMGAIGSAPIAFSVVVIAAGIVMWGVIQWSYGALLAGKNTEIAFLERRLADWREKMAGMSPDEAQARLHALETQVKTLQIRLEPRTLTNDMRQALIDRARLRPGHQYTVSVLREADCSDCERFAAELVAALRETQSWTADVGVLAEKLARPRYGLAIRVADPLRPPPEAVRLQGALQSARIGFEMIGGGAGANVELIVTERPVQ